MYDKTETTGKRKDVTDTLVVFRKVKQEASAALTFSWSLVQEYCYIRYFIHVGETFRSNIRRMAAVPGG